mmetsp:Transcript_366/g.877  ORF Transcript_366/g.877 Transcript_366/m.877 type:complete len:235 (-) Transcript_366:399-1103(-)
MKESCEHIAAQNSATGAAFSNALGAFDCITVRASASFFCPRASLSLTRWLSTSSALPATCRHSGSGTSSNTFCTPGSSLGMKRKASCASSTSLHMLSVILHARRLMATACWWARPLASSGVMMASVGASTCCTNVVAPSLCTQSGVFSGLAIVSASTSTNGVMSRFPTILQTLQKASCPACFVSFLLSVIGSEMSGTMSGRQTESSEGAVSVSCARKLSAATRVVHFSLIPNPL